jgi:hypothetical protein
MKLEMSQKVMDAINEVQKIIIFFMEDSQWNQKLGYFN